MFCAGAGAGTVYVCWPSVGKMQGTLRNDALFVHQVATTEWSAITRLRGKDFVFYFKMDTAAISLIKSWERISEAIKCTVSQNDFCGT